MGERLDAPLITGETPVKERERLFEAFRTGEVRVLVVSKVANFSIDLPDAGVAIQVSGSFGSRQEEAQRLGRVLRPKADGRTARFYAVVAARHRRRRLRRAPPALPRRAGLRLPHRRRRRRPPRRHRPQAHRLTGTGEGGQNVRWEDGQGGVSCPGPCSTGSRSPCARVGAAARVATTAMATSSAVQPVGEARVILGAAGTDGELRLRPRRADERDADAFSRSSRSSDPAKPDLRVLRAGVDRLVGAAAEPGHGRHDDDVAPRPRGLRQRRAHLHTVPA